MLTYEFYGKGPINYKLQGVTVIIQGDNGEEMSKQNGKEVIAVGTSDEAVATIDFFALNTQFYIPQDSTFLIPRRAFQSAFDRRIQQRTAAWHIATEFGRMIRESQGEFGENEEVMAPIVAQGRRLVAATGYWSTWASALEAFQLPVRYIRDVLVSKPAQWDVGPGPHNPYPGTNPRVAP